MKPNLKTIDMHHDMALIDDSNLIWAAVPRANPHCKEILARIGHLALDHDFIEKKPFTALISFADQPNSGLTTHVRCDPDPILLREHIRNQFTTPDLVVIHHIFPGHLKEVL